MHATTAMAPADGVSGVVAWLEAEYDLTAEALARFRRGIDLVDAADRARLRPLLLEHPRLHLPMISLKPAVPGHCPVCLQAGGSQ